MFNLLITLAVALGQTAPLTATPAISVEGGPGHFDFMGVDPVNRFVFVCHPGLKSFTVVNLADGSAKNVDCQTEVNGICADPKAKRVYAAGPGKKLVCFDETNWTKVGELAFDGPGDCVQFDSRRGVVYVDNDDGTNLWIVDPAGMKLSSTVTIHEAPEYMEYDDAHNIIVQAIKSTATVQIINPDTHAVTSEYKLGDLTSPHGLALDRDAGRIFVAGKNGKLVILDEMTGKIVGELDVVIGSDQIAYDALLKRLYVPSQGQLQVIQISGDSGKVVGSVPVGKDCHRVIVDPTTHDVWVAWSEADGSKVQKFTAGT